MLCPWARHIICIASVDSAVKWVPGGDNLVKGVQCYELFWGIALKNHVFFLFLKQSSSKKDYHVTEIGPKSLVPVFISDTWFYIT